MDATAARPSSAAASRTASAASSFASIENETGWASASAGGRRRDRTRRHQLVDGAGGPVPDVHRVAGLDQAPGDRGTHGAETEEAEVGHQAFQTVFRLQNSLMPAAASSRP